MFIAVETAEVTNVATEVGMMMQARIIAALRYERTVGRVSSW